MALELKRCGLMPNLGCYAGRANVPVSTPGNWPNASPPLPAWERGEVKPTLKQVGHFANSLHVPLGYRAELERLRANSKGSGGNFYWPQGARVG